MRMKTGNNNDLLVTAVAWLLAVVVLALVLLKLKFL